MKTPPGGRCHGSRKPPNTAPMATLAAMTATVLLLTACGGTPRTADAEASADNGVSVPLGAGKEEFQEALADMEPVQLTLQSANTAPSPAGQRETALGARIEEWSGGKITVEMVYANGMVAAEEADDALLDGRLDLHFLVPFLTPSEYPLNGGLMIESTIQGDSSVVAGALASYGALNEVAWETEAIAEEFEPKGLTPLTPIMTDNNTVVACAAPLTSLDDLQGRSIRVGSAAHYQQIRALGATPVSVPFIELYESLQRGIVDCLLIGAPTMTEGGLLEVAPHLMATEGAIFAGTPGVMMAGNSWPTLPLAAQQLIFDLANAHSLTSAYDGFGQNLDDVVELAEEYGGGLHSFEDDVNEALGEENERITADWADVPRIDGRQFTEDVEQASAEWLEIVEEIGYSRDTQLPDHADWQGIAEDDAAREAYSEVLRERILEPNRPS